MLEHCSAAGHEWRSCVLHVGSSSTAAWQLTAGRERAARRGLGRWERAHGVRAPPAAGGRDGGAPRAANHGSPMPDCSSVHASVIQQGTWGGLGWTAPGSACRACTACSHCAGAPHACCTMSNSWLILCGPFIAVQAASAAGGRVGTEEGSHLRPGECRRRAASCCQLPPAAQRRRPLSALAPLPPPPFMHRCASQIHYHSPHSLQLPLLKIDCHGAGNDAWGVRDPEARPPASAGGLVATPACLNACLLRGRSCLSTRAAAAAVTAGLCTCPTQLSTCLRIPPKAGHRVWLFSARARRRRRPAPRPWTPWRPPAARCC